MAKEKLCNLSDVRRANCKLIFDTLYKTGGMTLLDVEQSTGLSRPTVVGMVRAMDKAGLIKNVGKRESNGGRTPVLYGINPEAYYAVGVDFEYPTVRVILSDMKGKAVVKTKTELPEQPEPEEVIDSLAAQIKELIEYTSIDREKVLGIGLGMPGYIDLKEGVSIRFERLKDWNNIEIVRLLSEKTGLSVFMENDVHLLYRAEHELWEHEDDEDVLFIAIRSGIGSAIYQRGHIVEGEYGNAGFIGHTVIRVDGEKCSCGNYGCLELYASERAIRNKYEELTGIKYSSVNDVVNQAKAGKEIAGQVLREAGKYLGVGIGNVINMLDINTVIVSAYFDMEILLESTQEVLNRMINIPQGREVEILPSRLSEEEYALGGCKLVFNRRKDDIMSIIPLKNL